MLQIPGDTKVVGDGTQQLLDYGREREMYLVTHTPPPRPIKILLLFLSTSAIPHSAYRFSNLKSAYRFFFFSFHFCTSVGPIFYSSTSISRPTWTLQQLLHYEDSYDWYLYFFVSCSWSCWMQENGLLWYLPLSQKRSTLQRATTRHNRCWNHHLHQ